MQNMQTFSEMQFPEVLSLALNNIGFVDPTEIQKRAIPTIMEGRDLIACAETGSGKTGAYLIPMVKALMENPEAQGLVLAPTRELAIQISDFLKTLVPDEKAFHTTRLVGGQDIRKQFKSLQRKPRVIVATPGRLIDHLKRNTVQIHNVGFLVLDEGDRMIDMGFEPQLQQILKYLPEKRQTSFFTATMGEKVKNLAKKYLNKPVSLFLNDSRPVASIKQTVVQVEFKDKDECILHELNSRTGSVIVFLKTKHRTDLLTKYLSDYGLDVDLIHGGRTQGQRNKAINGFKKGKTRILCATDVAARGIDVPHVEHVINFDLPMQDEDYVHRIGRTARNGAEGEAISFVTPQEHWDWNRIVKKYDIPNCLLEIKKGSRPPRSREGGPSRGRKFGKKTGGKRFGVKDGESFGSKFGGKKSSFKRSDREEGESYGKKSSGKKFAKKEGDSFGKKKTSKKSSGKKSFGQSRAGTKRSKPKKALRSR